MIVAYYYLLYFYVPIVLLSMYCLFLASFSFLIFFLPTSTTRMAFYSLSVLVFDAFLLLLEEFTTGRLDHTLFLVVSMTRIITFDTPRFFLLEFATRCALAFFLVLPIAPFAVAVFDNMKTGILIQSERRLGCTQIIQSIDLSLTKVLIGCRVGRRLAFYVPLRIFGRE